MGRNLVSTPTEVISEQLQEKRSLPMGRTEFEEWSDRIIGGAGVQATVVSQKFALANMILHLGPHEAFKEDGYFINQLRKYAANEVAHAIAVELKQKAVDAEKARLEASETPEYKAAREEEEKKQLLAQPGPRTLGAVAPKVVK